MAKIFDTPFAINGEMEAIPLGTQGNGRVSFSQGFTLDYEKNLLTDPAAKDIERKKLNYLFNTICNAINKLQEDGGGVIGVPIPYPSTNVPVGYVPYDGRRFDTMTSPILASLFPNGYLPDLRGLVIRGLDAGRGYDPGRGILSYQQDMIQDHAHIAGAETLYYDLPQAVQTRNTPGGAEGRWYRNRTGSVAAVLGARFGNETCVKNMAFYYITKVG